MYKNYPSILALGILLIFATQGFAQLDPIAEARKRAMNLDPETILNKLPELANDQDQFADNMPIPSLRILIDTALSTSPLLNQQDAMIRIREWELKSQKWDWSNYLEGFTELRYGSVDNVFISPTGSTIGTDISVGYRYNVGTRINMSLFDVTDFRRKVKLAREKVDFEIYKREEVEKFVASEVIKLYNALKTYKQLIPLKAEHATAQQLNLAEAKMLYEAGDVAIVEYARIKDFAAGAEEEVILAQKAFRDAYMLLGELIGVPDISSLAVKN